MATTKSAPAATAAKPAHISICDLSELAFAQAEAAIRDGYSFTAGMPPDFFHNTGYVAINLVLNPAPAA